VPVLGDVGPGRWEISRESLKQVASKGANRSLGKDRRLGLIMGGERRITALL